jgi:hypothetical protein
MKLDRAALRRIQPVFKRAGPWAVTHIIGNRGDHHVVRVRAPFSRTEAAYRTIMVRGGMRRVECPDGEPAVEYLAGMNHTQLPAYGRPGIYISEYTEDGTFLLCVQRIGRDPRMHHQFLHGATAAMTIPEMGVLAIGSGEVLAKGSVYVGPHALYAESGPVDVEVLKPIQGILAWLPADQLRVAR